MRFWDMLKLVGYEYRYEKKEWILSLILQCLAFIGVFFLFAIAGDIDRVCGEYLSPLYPDGYAFNLTGYDESDICELEGMGFHDITFSGVSGQGGAVTDSLSGIWSRKLYAVFTGKDIWNNAIDEILSIIFLPDYVGYDRRSTIFDNDKQPGKFSGDETHEETKIYKNAGTIGMFSGCMPGDILYICGCTQYGGHF